MARFKIPGIAIGGSAAVVLALTGILTFDEGRRTDVYRDNLGNPSVGVGHLVTGLDSLRVGDSISDRHIDSLLRLDIRIALRSCRRMYTDFDSFPSSVQIALANMMFNIGEPKMRSYKNFNGLINARNWTGAADFIRTYFRLWQSQVGDRAGRIEEMFRAAQRETEGAHDGAAPAAQ